jgi:nucleotide-binding universal stress UspA family protein
MTRVLVPVAILKGETVSGGLIDLLGTVDVTVLGYHLLPEQTPPDQARAQFEDRATSALEDITEEFRAAGGDADHRLVFTGDRQQTVDRIATEIGADARAVTGATGDVDQLLVALSNAVAISRLMTFVTTLVGDREIGVTLLAAEGTTQERLDEAVDRLDAAGVDAGLRITEGDAFDALVRTAPGHDAIVMGEASPSLSSLLFGEESERVATASVGPVLVVRKNESETEQANAESGTEQANAESETE